MIGQSVTLLPTGTNALIEKTNGTAEQTIRGIASGSAGSTANSKLNLESNYIYSIFGSYANSAINFNSQAGNEFSITNYIGFQPIFGTSSVLSIRKGNSSLASFNSYGMQMGDNMGIGFGISPIFPITIGGSALGDKISLGGLTASGFGTSYGPHNGMGLQNNLFQIFSKSNTDDIAFGYGESGAFTENIRVKGNGRLGIGTPTPDAQIDVIRGIGTSGTAAFRGTTYITHFNYTTTEDTYLRGGKVGSKVLINDIAGMGSVGVGLSNPNELLDVNGRMRIRHNVNTSGLWLSNSANSLSSADGAFYGMKTDTETGIYIGNAWRFWVNSAGNVTSSSLSGTGNRPVMVDANGTLTAAASSQVLLLQPSHFHALSSSTSNIRSENSISFSGTGVLVAPVDLPVGAKINTIILRVKDNTNSGRILYSLEKMSTSSNIAIQLSTDGSTIGSANASALNWSSTSSLPVTIATNNYYYINITAYDGSGNLISWGSGTTFDFRWIEIQYTF